MESLSELLVRELSDLRRFCALLVEERRILNGAEADRLGDIANEKSSLAAQLNRVEARRDALLAKAGFARGRAGTEAWLASLPGAETERHHWAEVLQLAAQARDENETNGRLIGILLRQNQDALSVLLSGGADSIYGTDGQQRSLSDGKRSLGSA